MDGRILRRARAHRGLTQTQLAEIAGIEQANISAIETGRRAPSVETLRRLLHACGFEVVAVAGDCTLPLPAPEDAHLAGESVLADELPPVDLPIATRARMLTAALDAAEAIVRSR